MATRNLIEKIEALPPEKVAEVEDFVDFLTRARRSGLNAPGSPTTWDERRRRIEGKAEELRRGYGVFDSVSVIRELRDSGA
jgi:hypothetical protein